MEIIFLHGLGKGYMGVHCKTSSTLGGGLKYFKIKVEDIILYSNERMNRPLSNYMQCNVTERSCIQIILYKTN